MARGDGMNRAADPAPDEIMVVCMARHSRLTFVPVLDFCAGLGHNPLRKHGAGAQHRVSDLGQFDCANGRLRLLTTHPG